MARMKHETMRDVDKALMQEVAHGTARAARIRELVSLGADVNAVRDGESVLSEVVFSIALGGDRKIVDLLIELGADPTYVGDEGESALWEACRIADADLVSFLLENGADPNIIGERNETLLDAVEEDRWISGSGSFDDWVYDDDGSNKNIELRKEERIRNLDAVISLLREHGAKSLVEMKTDVVSRWLVLFASYPHRLDYLRRKHSNKCFAGRY